MNIYKNTTELIVRLVIKRNDKVLLCKNLKNGHYFLPGGHVEFGDSLEETVYKEMSEELGLNKEDIHKISFINYLEAQYGEGEDSHCELNMIFSADLSDVEIKSQEDHIDFEWFIISEIENVNLLPTKVKEYIL